MMTARLYLRGSQHEWGSAVAGVAEDLSMEVIGLVAQVDLCDVSYLVSKNPLVKKYTAVKCKTDRT